MDLISIESQEIIDKIDQELLAYVPAKPLILNQACEMSLTGGKRIRGLICSCSCLAVGGTMEVAIPLAVSVELAHAFSLVHDDIVDDDAIRRGKPAIHAELDSKIAVIVGDYIHGTFYRSLHTIFVCV
jgi:geranylgeranyl pyrophosphate synthase